MRTKDEIKDELKNLLEAGSMSGDYDAVEDMANQLLEFIEQLNGKWIDATEQQPDSMADVIVYLKHGGSQSVGYYHEGVWFLYEDTDVFSGKNVVTHWRNMPEDPI
jgi:hypothetical protein